MAQGGHESAVDAHDTRDQGECSVVGEASKFVCRTIMQTIGHKIWLQFTAPVALYALLVICTCPYNWSKKHATYMHNHAQQMLVMYSDLHFVLLYHIFVYTTVSNFVGRVTVSNPATLLAGSPPNHQHMRSIYLHCVQTYRFSIMCTAAFI